MDGIESVSENVVSEPNGEDIRVGAPGVQLTDIVEFRPETLDELQKVIDNMERMPLPQGHKEAFVNMLLYGRNSWVVKMGDVGMAWVMNIVPGYAGHFDFCFWDLRLTKNRREGLKTVIGTAFEKFQLTRMSAACSVTDRPFRDTFKKLGFLHEGTIREAWLSDPREDMFVFGMLHKEIPWPLLKMISLG